MISDEVALIWGWVSTAILKKSCAFADRCISDVKRILMYYLCLTSTHFYILPLSPSICNIVTEVFVEQFSKMSKLKKLLRKSHRIHKRARISRMWRKKHRRRKRKQTCTLFVGRRRKYAPGKKKFFFVYRKQVMTR